MGEVAIPRQMFQEILRLIAELRPMPPPTPAQDVRYSALKSNRREDLDEMPGKMGQIRPSNTVRRPGMQAAGPTTGRHLRAAKSPPSSSSSEFIRGSQRLRVLVL